MQTKGKMQTAVRKYSRRLITFRKDVERFRFLVMKSSFRFPNGVIAVPATSFINDFGEGFDASGVSKNHFDVNKRVETIHIRF